MENRCDSNLSGLPAKVIPGMVCYCFNYTQKMIEDDFKRNGRSTIKERIAREVKNHNCRCKIKNPKRVCCLGDVAKIIKELDKPIK